MSYINGGPLALGLDSGGFPDFENAPSQTWAPTNASLPTPPDAIGPGWGQMPSAFSQPFGTPGSGSVGPSSVSGNLSGILSGLMSTLSNLLGQLGSLFGASSAGGQSSPGGPPQGASQTFFSTASASSVGDPHDAFAGTTAAGSTLGERWNSMRGHADLLSSDSFAGGYRVATQVTAPQADGITYNAQASIATQGGATTVAMNADGSYTVQAEGQNVALTQGQAVQLGSGESVVLNPDASLTVSDTNAQGGTISTKLKANGNGGVDVTTNAANVDLGGYLVNQSDGAAPAPAQAGLPVPQPISLGFPPWSTNSPNLNPSQPFSMAGVDLADASEFELG